MALRWETQTRLPPPPVGAAPPATAAALARVRLVAFDLDSTLVDFFRWKERACEGAVRALINAGVDLETTANGPVQLSEAVLAQRLVDTYFRVGVESDAAIAEFLTGVGQAPDPALIAVAVEGYLRAKASALEAYPRTVPTLVHLLKRGYDLAVVTDAPRPKALHRLAATGLLPFFDTIITIDDAGGGKDTGLPFEELLRRTATRADEVLMVGDWPEKDIRVPKRLGMATALARYGMRGVGATVKSEDSPDLVLGRIDDLTRALKGAPRPAQVRA